MEAVLLDVVAEKPVLLVIEMEMEVEGCMKDDVVVDGI